MQEKLEQKSTLDISLSSPEIKIATHHQELLEAGYKRPDISAIYKTHLTDGGKGMQGLVFKGSGGYPKEVQIDQDKNWGNWQRVHGNSQVMKDFPLDHVPYPPAGMEISFVAVDDDEYPEDTCIAEESDSNTIRGDNDAGAVFGKREPNAESVRVKAPFKYEISLELKVPLEKQLEDAQGYDEDDDQIFYPVGGKHLPRSPPKTKRATKRGIQGRHQQSKAISTDSERAYWNPRRSVTYSQSSESGWFPSSGNTPTPAMSNVSDHTHYYGTTQHHPRIPSSHNAQFNQENTQGTPLGTPTRTSTVQTSQLKPESPAFSFTRPQRRAEQPKQKNGLLEMLPQTPDPRDKRVAAKCAQVAAYLNHQNRLLQVQARAYNAQARQDPYNNSPYQAYNVQVPQNTDHLHLKMGAEFDFGSNNMARSNTSGCEDSVYKLHVARPSQSRVSELPRNYQSNHIASGNTQGSGITNGNLGSGECNPFDARF